MHPWRIPGCAWLSNDWNRAVDLAASLPLPVSLPGLAAAWEELGPGEVLGTLRALAGAGGKADAENATTREAG